MNSSGLARHPSSNVRIFCTEMLSDRWVRRRRTGDENEICSSANLVFIAMLDIAKFVTGTTSVNEAVLVVLFAIP